MVGDTLVILGLEYCRYTTTLAFLDTTFIGRKGFMVRKYGEIPDTKIGNVCQYELHSIHHKYESCFSNLATTRMVLTEKYNPEISRLSY